MVNECNNWVLVTYLILLLLFQLASYGNKRNLNDFSSGNTSNDIDSWLPFLKSKLSDHSSVSEFSENHPILVGNGGVLVGSL